MRRLDSDRRSAEKGYPFRSQRLVGASCLPGPSYPEYSQGCSSRGKRWRVAWVRIPLAWENTDCQNLYSGSGRDTLMVKRTSEAAAGEAGWSTGLTVRAEGAGTVANAGV